MPRPRSEKGTEVVEEYQPIDAAEVFGLVRHIKDPEHPLSLEDLKVVSQDLIRVFDDKNQVFLTFTPTVPHCSMCTLIGLCIRARLNRTLPSRMKIEVRVTPESHQTEDQINKQLADKERVQAALENPNLRALVDVCLSTCNDAMRKEDEEKEQSNDK